MLPTFTLVLPSTDYALGHVHRSIFQGPELFSSRGKVNLSSLTTFWPTTCSGVKGAFSLVPVLSEPLRNGQPGEVMCCPDSQEKSSSVSFAWHSWLILNFCFSRWSGEATPFRCPISLFYKWLGQLHDLVPTQWMLWIRPSPAMLYWKEVAEMRGLRQNTFQITKHACELWALRCAGYSTGLWPGYWVLIIAGCYPHGGTW